jgi:hypothetical protein
VSTGHSSDIATPCRAYAESVEAWDMADDLCGGTQRMREAGSKYLPRRKKEADEDFKFRQSLAFLYPGFASAIGDLTSRPFEREVTLIGAGPDAERIAADVDRAGTDITEHASDRFVSGLKYGVSHVLVEMAGDGEQSRADELQGKARPYFVAIHPKNLLGARFADQRLVGIRFRTFTDEPDGEFGEKLVERVVVWELQPEGWILVRRWVKADAASAAKGEGGWIEEQQKQARPARPFAQIPMDTVWFGEPNGIAARTPLYDLAWKNLEHFQARARHRYSLEFSAAGLLWISGMAQKELEAQGGVSIGGAHALTISNADGKVGVAESTGASLASSKDDCDGLMREMRSLGQRHLEERSTATATGERVDESRATSNVKRWIRLLESGMRRCFGWAAQWQGQELPESFGVQIFSDFSPLTDRSTDALRDAFAQGALSLETYLREMQRRGIVAADLDIEEEVERIETASAAAWKEQGLPGTETKPDADDEQEASAA